MNPTYILLGLAILISACSLGCIQEGQSQSNESVQEEPEGPIECEEMSCFSDAAEKCVPARYTWESTLSIFGVEQTTVTYMELRGMEAGKCVYHFRIESIDIDWPPGTSQETIGSQEALHDALEGREGTCKFEPDDFAELVDRWEAGSFSTGDYDDAECTGNYFDPLEVEWETVEPLDDENGTLPTVEEFKIPEEGCWMVGDPENMSVHNHIYYVTTDIPVKCDEPELADVITRWDDYCADEDAVMKVACRGVYMESGRRACPEGTRCLDGACLNDSEYANVDKCQNLSGGDRMVELCSGHTFTHDSGIIFRPKLILSQFGGIAENAIIYVEGANMDELEDTYGYKFLRNESGESVAFGLQQYDKDKMVFIVRTKGGIDPSVLEE
jgi:hypothetical protein